MNKKLSILIVLIYSFVLKFFNSLASLLFDFSSFQIDNSTFYMVGKALINGKILYKDIFDHRAPYIYLINVIASLINYKHIGLYILESISLFIILLFILKIVFLFTDKTKYCFVITISVFGILFTSTIITYGMAKTKMYSTMFFIISSYLYLLNEKNNTDISNRDMFLIGIFAGLSFLINIKQILMYMSIALVLLFI